MVVVEQLHDTKFLLLEAGGEEVLEWLARDCAWVFKHQPLYTNERDLERAKVRHSHLITFVDRKGALEFKLRWYKNA
jgi:hypothetical protein